MASKETLVRQLDEHLRASASLYAEWDAAGCGSDETTARACHAKERDSWMPRLKDLLGQIDPSLWVKYADCSPYKRERVVPSVFVKWGREMAGGFANLAERIDLLKADVADLARRHHIDLTTPAAPVKPLSAKDAEKAYAEHVKATRREIGCVPTSEKDERWRKLHGLTRDRVRKLRNNCPERTEKDRRGGRRNLAKK